MKTILGYLLIVGGIAFGAYMGLWWAFVGGIVQVIEAFQASPVNAVDVALGALRVLCAGAIGGISAVVFVFPGTTMVTARRW